MAKSYSATMKPSPYAARPSSGVFVWISKSIIVFVIVVFVIMPPTSKKLTGHIAFGLCIGPFIKNHAC